MKNLLTLLAAILLFQLHAAPSGNAYPTATNTNFIRASCNATLYPDLCYTSLSGYANAVQQDPDILARVAIRVSLSRTRNMAAYISNVSRHVDYGGVPRASAALHDCFSLYDDAVGEIRDSLRQMMTLGGASGESLRFELSNVQTWMSAALTNGDTCTEGFGDVPDCPLKANVSKRVVRVTQVISNALALVNSYASKVTPP